MKKIFYIAMAFFTISFASICQAEENVNIFESPRTLPKTAIQSYTGSMLNMQDFKGDFVLLMIWSRYCMPCVRELDDIQGFIKKTKENGVKVVLLSDSSEWLSVEEQKRFLKKYGADDMDFYIDNNADLAAQLGVFKYPHTVLINKKAQEIGRIRGSVDWDDDDVIEYIYKIKAQHG